MKFGDYLTGTIQALDSSGRGVFQTTLQDGSIRRVLVPFTTPGDVIEAKFVKRDKGAWIADLVRVIQPAETRTKAPCPHAGVCGGCLWQHLPYEAQAKLKETALRQAYDAAGIPLATIKPLVAATRPLHHRNRMDYVVGWKGEVGLKAFGRWNQYIDITDCLLLDETTKPILETTRELMRSLELAPWDAKHHCGDLRYVVIRRGVNTGERLITLIVHNLAHFDEQKREAIVRALSPFASSLFLGENPDITDLSYAKTLVRLYGEDRLHERVGDVMYRIHPNAFFQTNTEMADVLQQKTLEALGDLKEATILDLYCGLGFFGIAAAKRGATVYGYELDPFAIAEAKENAKENQVDAVTTWQAGPVETSDWTTHGGADAAIVDPPRAGLHPKAIDAILAHGPARLVYISCQYSTFLKEWPRLREQYELSSAEPIDLFPQTPHVEVVHVLNRRAHA